VWDVVRCWRDRHEVLAMDPDDRGRVLFGIVDWHNGGAWVETGGEREQYPLQSSAEQWIRGRRYLDEVYHRAEPGLPQA
jgi:hypothetical protein